MSDVAAVLLFTAVVLYAVFGGADFGAGFWDLTAGDARRGARTRALIERSIGPVWEANHVWLVFCLVILWTAFPDAFAAILTTLYVPLVLAMFGIVLRGCGFAFRKQVQGVRASRAAGAVFAASSVVTPFFLGATAGGIASGRVLLPPDHAGAMEVWVNPTALLMGALAVVACAYLSAVFLVAEARKAGDAALEARFRRCALGAAAVVGVLAAAGIGVLRADSPRMFHRLLGPGLPLVIVSAVCGLFTLAQPRRVSPQILRLVAVARGREHRHRLGRGAVPLPAGHAPDHRRGRGAARDVGDDHRHLRRGGAAVRPLVALPLRAAAARRARGGLSSSATSAGTPTRDN